jgi:hypothetical protein
MTWQIAIGIALLVVVVLWRLARQLNPKVTGTASAPPAPNRLEPTMEELPSALQGGMRGVREAVDRCEKAQGDDDLAVRRRELAETLRDSTTALRALATNASPGSRIPRVTRLAAQEMCEVAGPWLSVRLVVPEEGSMTSQDMSEWQRNLWHRAEEMIAACVEARGDDLVAARKRLRQFVREITASSEAFLAVDGLMSERSALMWQLAVEEIGEFAADALARQPEQQP